MLLSWTCALPLDLAVRLSSLFSTLLSILHKLLYFLDDFLVGMDSGSTDCPVEIERLLPLIPVLDLGLATPVRRYSEDL